MNLVTHLECSLTGERYEAGQVHNLSARRQRMAAEHAEDAGGDDE